MDIRDELLAELAANGVKHTPESIVAIGRDANGRVVFLEQGTTGRRGAGLRHIIKDHEFEFLQRGISTEQIPEFVMLAVMSGRVVGEQGNPELVVPRPIYEVEYNGKLYQISISVGSNGYIVGANFRTDPKLEQT